MTGPCAGDALLAGWREAGIEPGMHVIVHSALSSMGPVQGGPGTVLATLQTAVGQDGTLVAPTFTPQVSDPHPEVRSVPDDDVRARREQVPLFTPDLPSPMGAVAESLRRAPEAMRSWHPQASVAAVGTLAERIVSRQPLHFAVGEASPFDALYELGGFILLVGVGHNRNSFLHFAESLIAQPRLKQRRFPLLVHGERVWVETLDVGDDGDTHFPIVGREYEEHAEITPTRVGQARAVLLPVRDFVPFASRRLAELTSGDGSGISSRGG